KSHPVTGKPLPFAFQTETGHRMTVCSQQPGHFGKKSRKVPLVVTVEQKNFHRINSLFLGSGTATAGLDTICTGVSFGCGCSGRAETPFAALPLSLKPHTAQRNQNSSLAPSR